MREKKLTALVAVILASMMLAEPIVTLTPNTISLNILDLSISTENIAASGSLTQNGIDISVTKDVNITAVVSKDYLNNVFRIGGGKDSNISGIELQGNHAIFTVDGILKAEVESPTLSTPTVIEGINKIAININKVDTGSSKKRMNITKTASGNALPIVNNTKDYTDLTLNGTGAVEFYYGTSNNGPVGIGNVTLVKGTEIKLSGCKPSISASNGANITIELLNKTSTLSVIVDGSNNVIKINRANVTFYDKSGKKLGKPYTCTVEIYPADGSKYSLSLPKDSVSTKNFKVLGSVEISKDGTVTAYAKLDLSSNINKGQVDVTINGIEFKFTSKLVKAILLYKVSMLAGIKDVQDLHKGINDISSSITDVYLVDSSKHELTQTSSASMTVYLSENPTEVFNNASPLSISGTIEASLNGATVTPSQNGLEITLKNVQGELIPKPVKVVLSAYVNVSTSSSSSTGSGSSNTTGSTATTTTTVMNTKKGNIPAMSLLAPLALQLFRKKKTKKK